MKSMDRSPQESFKEESILKDSKLEKGRELEAGDSRQVEAGMNEGRRMMAINLLGGQSVGLPHCRRIPFQLSHKGSPYFGRHGSRSEDRALALQGCLRGPKPLELQRRRGLNESCVQGNSLAQAREPGVRGPEGIYSILQPLQGPHQGRNRGLN